VQKYPLSYLQFDKDAQKQSQTQGFNGCETAAHVNNVNRSIKNSLYTVWKYCRDKSAGKDCGKIIEISGQVVFYSGR
jgi:hypothetical protein